MSTGRACSNRQSTFLYCEVFGAGTGYFVVRIGRRNAYRILTGVYHLRNGGIADVIGKAFDGFAGISFDNTVKGYYDLIGKIDARINQVIGAADADGDLFRIDPQRGICFQSRNAFVIGITGKYCGHGMRAYRRIYGKSPVA